MVVGRQGYPLHCPQRIDKMHENGCCSKPQPGGCCSNTFLGIVNQLLLLEKGREKTPCKEKTAGTAEEGQGEPGTQLSLPGSREIMRPKN